MNVDENGFDKRSAKRDVSRFQYYARPPFYLVKTELFESVDTLDEFLKLSVEDNE